MSALPDEEYVVHMPGSAAVGLDQDEEHCIVELADERRVIRFHDYDEIYAVPGLYEKVFAETLDCDSPRVVVDLLQDVLEQEDVAPQAMQVLDFGAGNGMVAEELTRIGTSSIVGVDLLPEAKLAAERDRPGVYEAYHVVDLANPTPDECAELDQYDFDAMTCVAALGFGDVPVEAFATAFDLVSDGGWVAFNIRDRFIDESADSTGFSRALAAALEEDVIVEHARMSYVHRLSTAGDPLPYVAIVGRKQGELGLVT